MLIVNRLCLIGRWGRHIRGIAAKKRFIQNEKTLGILNTPKLAWINEIPETRLAAQHLDFIQLGRTFYLTDCLALKISGSPLCRNICGTKQEQKENRNPGFHPCKGTKAALYCCLESSREWQLLTNEAQGAGSFMLNKTPDFLHL